MYKLKLKSFLTVNVFCFLLTLFSINVHAAGIYQVDSELYSRTLNSCSKSGDTYVAEIDFKDRTTDKKILVQLVKIFKIPFFLEENEIQRQMSLEDIARFSDIMPSMYVLHNIHEVKICLFLKNFTTCLFTGDEFSKDILMNEFRLISRHWESLSQNKKDFSIFYT